jgi:hypothetical protein
MNCKLRVMIDVVQRYLTRVDRLGLDPRVVLIRHQYVFALLWNTRYPEAVAMQRETSLMANRLGDSRSKAYSLADEIHVSIIVAPIPTFGYVTAVMYWGSGTASRLAVRSLLQTLRRVDDALGRRRRGLELRNWGLRSACSTWGLVPISRIIGSNILW